MESNPIIEEMLNQNPLVVFSIYTHAQSRTVRDLGQDILNCFERGIMAEESSDNRTMCDEEVMSRGYGQFWLWVIGAYEVVRTMCQVEQCFMPSLATELKELKRQLSNIRMPFAKQELRGKTIPVRGEPSVHGISASPPDLKFEVEGNVISARGLIGEFERVFGAITRSDILLDHRTTYS